MDEGTKTCCFFGHRKVLDAVETQKKLYQVIEDLIRKEGIETFLFGSRSDFDALCLSTVTALQGRYPHIRRVYVRAEYPYISDSYERYLLKSYDATYFPEFAVKAGKAVYVERNREMIQKSKICVIYYRENYMPPTRKASKRSVTEYQPKSGTKLAYDYALQKQKTIVNVAEQGAEE